MSRDPDLLTAIVFDRGVPLAHELLDTHDRAWSSDSTIAAVRALDDRDLICLTIVALSARRSEKYRWLHGVCIAESDRRNSCPTCDGDGQVVEVLTPGLHPADPAHDVKEWECPDCEGTGQHTDETSAAA